MGLSQMEAKKTKVCSTSSCLIAVCVVMSIAILLSITFGYFYWGDLSLANENGITENVQAGCCALAGAAFGYAACEASMPPYFRFFVVFFAALSFAFILREIDVERLDVSQWLILIGSGLGRNLLYVAIFLPMLLRFAWSFRVYFSHGLVMLRTTTGVCIAVAGVLLISSEIAERLTFESHVMVEELLELTAYMSLLTGGLLSFRLSEQVARVTRSSNAEG